VCNNNYNNSHDNVYGVVIMTERRVAANPQTKPVDLGCESAENWQLSSTSIIGFFIAIVIITQPVS